MKPQRLVYFGTPALAIAPLEALLDAGFDIELVVSAADKRRGRGSDRSPSPVKQRALELGVVVSDDPDAILDTTAEAAVVVAYGRIIKSHLLERMPMVNLHVSLLPRWRGAAPIERAILAGDEQTGVCVMEVAEELDAGGVYARATTAIGHRNADELREELIATGAALLIEVLRAGLENPTPQTGSVSYAHKIDPGERRLDWTRSAVELDRVVRIGGAWTTFRGRRLKVLDAFASPDATEGLAEPGSLHGDGVVTGEGVLHLVTVQPEGRRAMGFDDWRRGVTPLDDDRLGA